MAKCQGCGAQVEWRQHVVTGKGAPVDINPRDDGNVYLEPHGTYRVLTAEEKAGPGFWPRYTLHFATCPQAKHFRRCGKCRHTPCRCGSRSSAGDANARA